MAKKYEVGTFRTVVDVVYHTVEAKSESEARHIAWELASNSSESTWSICSKELDSSSESEVEEV